MQAYNDWDDIQESEVGESKTLPADGYVTKILGVRITTSRAGNEMIELMIDIAEGDFVDFFKQKYEFKKQYDPSVKWSCVFRQLTRGNSAKYFKNLILNIERSNKGYNFKASNFDESTLKGKLIGFVFRDEEYNYNGHQGFTAKPFISKTVDDIRSGNFKLADRLLITPEKNIDSKANNDNDIDNMEIPF